MEFKKIGVVGAGTMGCGITVDLLLNGLNVVLVDISAERLDLAKEDICNAARFAPLVKRSCNKVSSDEVLRKTLFTTHIEDVKDCDFIVENVPEKIDVKRNIYKQLDDICRDDICFGADTSCISITELGSYTARPDKVVGMHLMNPVYMKSVVEVIKGYHTSEESLNTVHEFLRHIGKEAIVVNDFPGFVSNRLSHLLMNEAAFVVQDGVATVEQVDIIFQKCFGHAMGPLQTADIIGLDTVVDSLEVLYKHYQDPKFRCCPLLKKMVAAGLYGKKTKQGFYTYP